MTLVLLPIGLLVISNAWIFPPAGTLDPWYYVGYHFHLERLLRAFPDAYYGARVPWTIAGWLLHQVLGDVKSLYVLTLTLFFGSTLSLFFAARLIFRTPWPGFVAACALGTNPWFLLAVGWNYIDGPTLACMIISILGVALATHGDRWRLGAVICGAATATFIVLTLTYVVFVPIIAWLIVALNFLGRRRSLLLITLFATAGGAASLVIMGAANIFAGGTFFFLWTQMSAARSLMRHIDDWYAPWRIWLWNAPWLLVPGMFAVASTIWIARYGYSSMNLVFKDRTGSYAPRAKVLAIAAACSASAALFVFMQARHLAMLMYPYRTNALLPFAYLTLAAFLSISTPRVRSTGATIVSCATVLIFVTPLLLYNAGVFAGTMYAIGPIQVTLSSAAMRVGLTLVQLARSGFAGTALEFSWIIAGAVVLLAIASDRLSTGPRYALMAVLAIVTCLSANLSLVEQLQKNKALAIFDAARFVDSSTKTIPTLWWNDRDPDAWIFDSLGSMYLVPHPQSIQPGVVAIFLTSNISTLHAEDFKLLRRGISWHTIDQKHVTQGSVSFDIVVRSVRSAVSERHKLRYQ